jgi:simple sugar transport system permease protein
VVPIAIIAAILGGALMGAVYCFLTVTLKANQNVTGLAMTTFGVGVTKYIMSGMATSAFKSYLYALKYFRAPFSGASNGLKYWGIMMYLAIIIALGAAYVLSRTRVGLHLRAVGENPATADAVGINVTAYKYGATCIGSSIAALGGLYYIMDYMGSVEAYKTIEALGWLSVALVIFTLWKPNLSILGSIFFAALYVSAYYINGNSTQKELLKLIPYVLTVVVLIFTSIKGSKNNQAPASLGLSYFREER